MKSKRTKREKTVMITGAGTGIGLACVSKFLDKGWSVIAHYNSSKQELLAYQGQYPRGKLHLLKCDFRKIGQINKLVKDVVKIKLDGLINNAAMYDLSKKKKNRIDEALDVFLVNAIVPVLLSEKVMGSFKKKRDGFIINVSSIAAKYGSGIDNVFYSMSKRSLESLTRTLAREGAPYGILINTIRPGVTDTFLHKKIKKDLTKRKKLIPLKRLAKPQEIADAIYHLSVESSFVTNEIVTVAGGE